MNSSYKENDAQVESAPWYCIYICIYTQFERGLKFNATFGA